MSKYQITYLGLPMMMQGHYPTFDTEEEAWSHLDKWGKINEVVRISREGFLVEEVKEESE
jgi:hypothetical protein